MPSRITRRRLVGWLARTASAVAAIGLLRSVSQDDGEALSTHAAGLPPSAAVQATTHAADGPVSVRMADILLAGRDLRTGQADGVRLPSQGGDAWSLTAERPGGSYTTAPLRTAFPATHVGVHWQTDGGDQRGLRVELRSSRDGQSWTSWRPVQPESHGPDRPGHPDGRSVMETFGALVGTRLGSWVQARLTFAEAGPGQASISAITLTCLDSRRPDGFALTPQPPLPAAGEGELTSPASPLSRAQDLGTQSIDLSPSPAHRPGGLIGPGGEGLHFRAGLTGFLERVVSREAWGADESLRFKDGADVWPTAFVAPSLLVVHHTAGDGEIVDAEAEVRAIYAYHAVTQGWGDIGYNLLIDSSGRVYEGRRGRDPDASGQREIVSENVVAGHALDYNYGSVGVALLGNYQLRQPSTVMIDTLVEALAFMAQRSGLDPTTIASYPRARSDGTALWRDNLNTVSGHRDCIPTECPGENVYPLLPSIRQRVGEVLGAAGPAVRILRGPAERNFWPGDANFAWEADPSAVEVSTRLAGWVRAPGTDRITMFSGYSDDERPVWGPWTRQSDLSVPLPPDARGIYTLFVRAHDASGQIGRVVARWHLAVDRHVVVDDTDALRTRHDGDWERIRAILGYYGSGYQEAAAGQADAAFRWQLAVPEDGVYRLQISWTEAPNRTTAAAYQISQGGQPLGEETVNQQEPGGRWVGLLQAPLKSEAPCVVEVAGADDGVVVADAVRLVKLD